MGLLLFYLFLALAVSFLCSIMESVILSATHSFIQTKELEGNKAAKILRMQKTNIDRPLSAILTINTVAHTIGAAGVGAQATAIFGDAYFGIISAILTLLILIFSEIIPKTIGANYWRTLALSSARIIRFMIWISYPLVYISEIIARLISNKKSNIISRKEIATMASIGKNQGILGENESKIIQNLLKLNSVKVKEIMTPRTVMVTASEELNTLDFSKQPDSLSFSRIPVFKGSKDNITGYILKYDALEKLSNDEFSVLLKDMKRPVVMIYENITVPALFNKLLEEGEHISIVFDEFGGVSGITTMEDIIETILGLEIIDETDSDIDMQKLAKEKWKVRARKLNIHNLSKETGEKNSENKNQN